MNNFKFTLYNYCTKMYFCVLLLLLSNELPGRSYLVEAVKVEACSLKSSFVFARENTETDSALLKLPTYNGEKWSLRESGLEGYLMLTNSNDHYSLLLFAQSPDIEEISKAIATPKATLPFILECRHRGWNYKFNQELILEDVNEHPPVFDSTRSYNVSITESSIVGRNVFSLGQMATDPDVTNRIAGYSLTAYNDSEVDGREYFNISDDGNFVITSQPLDYDELKLRGGTYFKLNLTATDTGTPAPLASYVTLTIHVTDVDDQPPAFFYPECSKIDHFCVLPYFQAVIRCGFKGMLSLHPGPVFAVDRDTHNFSISYHITRVSPEQFTGKFDINRETGAIRVVNPLCSATVHEILLTITASENSPLKHSISATLQIEVLDNLMAWNIQSDDSNGSIDSRDSPDSSIVPFTLFILAILACLTVGALLTGVSVRAARNRRRNKISTSAHPGKMDTEDYGDCPACKSDKTLCFPSCSSSNPTSSINSHTGHKLTQYVSHSSEWSSDEDYLPSQAGLVSEMRTAFTSGSTNSYFLDEYNIQFQPSPLLPGHADTSEFYQGISTFGSMKHERKATRMDGDDDLDLRATLKQVGKFTIQFTGRSPEFFKTNDSRAGFDASNLTYSNV